MRCSVLLCSRFPPPLPKTLIINIFKQTSHSSFPHNKFSLLSFLPNIYLECLLYRFRIWVLRVKFSTSDWNPNLISSIVLFSIVWEFVWTMEQSIYKTHMLCIFLSVQVCGHSIFDFVIKCNPKVVSFGI